MNRRKRAPRPRRLSAGWLSDTILPSVRWYWGSKMRIWNLTHLEEHCGAEGSSTRQNTAKIVLGAHLRPFQIVLQYCWPSPPARSQYVVSFLDEQTPRSHLVGKIVVGLDT